MKITKALLVAALATAVSLPAFARDDNAHRINQRQAEQKQRIEEGVRSGALTRDEARDLKDEQRKIADEEAKARRGKFTDKERARISKMQDNADKHIDKKLNNKKRADGKRDNGKHKGWDKDRR